MVHVAGTNGKGSCCAMTERVLRAAGNKTGLYTSPYIEVYNERIRLNGEPIAGEKLAALVESVWPAVEECEKVDVAVIEVGLGGRLDPTNIIRPAVSVITEVGMDHMQLLGDTIEQIALEKAGIMKPSVPVVLGRQEKAARGVLLAAAKGMELPVVELTAENVREQRKQIEFDAAFGGDHHRIDEVITAVAAQLAERDLRAGQNDRFVKSLKHERQRGSSIGHRIGAVQDDEAVIHVVAVADLPPDVDPLLDRDIRRIQ